MRTLFFGAARISSVVVLGTGLLMLGAVDGWAQKKMGTSPKQLIGSWTLVSISTTQADGKKTQPFGPNPDGMLVFDARGRYTLQVCRPGRAKFASNMRDKGTPEENQATVQGCNPHWGKYAVEGHAIDFHIEHAMFPNWEGTTQKRTFTLQGDVLTYTVPTASTGGTSEVVWKRAK